MPAETVCWTVLDTPLGPTYAATTERGLCRLSLAAKSEAAFLSSLRKAFPTATITQAPEACPEQIEGVTAQVEAYWRSTRSTFDLPLDLRGTPFQLQVWEGLREIPYGQTWTYGMLAKRLGQPEGAQAVGAAAGQNPVLLIIPCHRLIGANGSLTGFAAGVAAKQALLRHEGALLL